MNNTIALPHLAEILATSANIDRDESEKFIKAFFSHIEDALAVSENVTIKGLGTFTRTSDAEHPIVFTIDPELSAAVNEPFEMFEAVAVGDADVVQTTETEARHNPPVQPIQTPDITQEVAVKNESLASSENTEPHVPPMPVAAQTMQHEEYKGIPLEIETPSTRNHTVAWSVSAFILGLLLGACMAFFGYETLSHIFNSEDVHDVHLQPEPTVGITIDEIETIEIDNVEKDTVSGDATEVTIAEPKELPQIKTEVQVFDTVTPNRFLTTMARQYYNQMEYWVFIYEANSDKLGNPNKIKPGTRVIIPARSDFETGGSREQTLDRAKRLAQDIYSRFE